MNFHSQLSPALAEYLLGPFSKIGGACDSRTFFTISLLLEFQEQNSSSTGNICEIGVRDGKLFIGLMRSVGLESLGLAIDIFDNQQFNIDGSGFRPVSHGVPFFNNCSLYVPSAERVKSLTRDSLSLVIGDIIDIKQQYGPFRVFSIDGGHEAEHIINDIRVAENTLTHAGFAMLDDYYNPNFPGVHEGYLRYLMAGNKLVPIAFSHGKLFVCNKTYHKKYISFLRERLQQLTALYSYRKLVKMSGYEVMHIVV